MSDTLSKEKRSWNMSRIVSKNTKPELIVRSLLHKMGYRFRLHSNKIPGKPDIILSKYHTVIFVHGCFWHQHKNCKDGKIPKSNTVYWIEKLNKNIQRDKENIKAIKRMGWKFLVVWECQLENIDRIKSKFRNALIKDLN